MSGYEKSPDYGGGPKGRWTYAVIAGAIVAIGIGLALLTRFAG